MTHLTPATIQATRTVNSDPDARACVRAAAGARGSGMPVRVVPGSVRPHVEGEGYYWTNTPNPDSGRVHHPSAYARRGYPCYYHCSSLEIVVGADWIRRHCPVPYALASVGEAAQ